MGKPCFSTIYQLAGRTRLRRNPPPLVHGADGRLLGGDLLLAHLPRQTLPDGPRMGQCDKEQLQHHVS